MQHRIIVIGAGFAGTWSALAARRLISSHTNNSSDGIEIEVIVIAPKPQLVMRPRLYEPDPAAMVAPLGDLFSATGVRFVHGIVDTINTTKKNLEVLDLNGGRSTMPYDRLVLAAGSRVVYPDIPGLHEHAFHVDDMEGAKKLDAHLHNLKSLPPSESRNTVVVCGAGFTGLEVVTTLPARLRSILGDDAHFRVILVGREKDVGVTFGPDMRRTIEDALAQLGVETRLGAAVTAIDAHGVTTAEERVGASTIIWAAGVAATSLTQQIDENRDTYGRLIVDSNLRLPSVQDVYATGDAAHAATDEEGNTTMMSCQHAIILGRVAGHNAAADLLGIPTMRYSQPAYVTCLDLGSYGAVVANGWDRQVVHEGAAAKEIKTYINGTLIYPPAANRTEAFEAADPASVAAGLPIPLHT